MIEHAGSEQKYEVPLKWDAKDSAESDWEVPKDAKTGVYRVLVEDSLARPKAASRGACRAASASRSSACR